MNLTEIATEHQAWSLATFPDENAASGLKKLEEEVEEIWGAIGNGSDFGCAEEYADAIMCLFSSAAHLGVTADMITEAFAEKLQVNRTREWIRNEDGTHSHKKEPALCPICNKPDRPNRPVTADEIATHCGCLPF